MRLTTIATTAASIAAVVAQDTSPSGPTMTGTAPDCNSWYTVKSGDTCPSVEEKFGITADQFFKWNPAVSRDCVNNFWVGESYCVGVGKPIKTSSTSSQVSSSTSTKTTSTKTTSTTSDAGDGKPYSTRFPVTSRNITTPTSPTAWPPTKTQPGEPDSCTNWHFVVPGDTCQRIVNRYGNTLNMRDFLAWNPALKSDCSALFIGYYVCIAIKPTTTSSFDWFNAPNTTIPSPTSWTPSVPPTINSTFTASPQQSGIPSSCQSFYKAEAGDTCNTVLKAYPYITEELFYKWNPALDGNCQGLWANYWYCVANYDPADLPQPPSQSTPGTPVGDNTVSGCKAWYQTTGGDDCDIIAQAFGSFSTSDFISWNPSVGSKCDDIKDNTYYCVGVAKTPTTRTSSVPATTTQDALPTQSGVASNCNKYWFVGESDTCRQITTASNILLGNFIRWNPAVNDGGSCKLTPDVNVCVGVKA
ncbi:peptidoglycan-binding protein [Akanthomyces lecanii RCEF 1005]|uniref:Peptidoglycan-binding protein n=1 Tax=Akanthomyces lecanii RCEF 1005 TaxID=1081108 RepID=A0A168F849_CORDF|nr:peptidoglycan-binding protein [Akanthomyces lecanii RCEF 1005]